MSVLLSVSVSVFVSIFVSMSVSMSMSMSVSDFLSMSVSVSVCIFIPRYGLDAANLRPALEQSCGQQTPSDRKLFPERICYMFLISKGRGD